MDATSQWGRANARRIAGWLNAAGHQVLTLTPDLFATVRCPTKPGVRFAVGVRHRLAQRLDDFAPCYCVRAPAHRFLRIKFANAGD